MIDAVEKAMRNMPSAKGKDAGVACIVGFIFGGIGLAIYFRNVADLFLPLAVSLALGIMAGGIGVLAGALVAALWGYFRVQLSQ
ncbi:hypothetical protein [Mycolicibacterium aichiense]|nr:hypothetical protein [Mycolicibacterium aichiense]MCV7019171.1 hypothetical protein [Mycolicibacterium aichiense]STZ24337.1 Uncharacterised protein [Mycolicibacterium aichiense]